MTDHDDEFSAESFAAGARQMAEIWKPMRAQQILDAFRRGEGDTFKWAPSDLAMLEDWPKNWPLDIPDAA